MSEEYRRWLVGFIFFLIVMIGIWGMVQLSMAID